MDGEMMGCKGENMVMKKWYGVHSLRMAVGITMLILLLVGGAEAMTLTVNANGGGDYTRIQDAIDNASSGDTILVYSGIYHENVNVNKQLTLRGIGNPVVVNAGGHRSVITMAANGITLEGFTATGSYSSKNAGIKVTSNNNTLIGNNASKNRNGIFLSSSSNNTLSGNNASNNRHSGISLYSSSNNTLSENNASNNNWNGIIMEYSGNNTLLGNNASNNYYGISISSSNNNMLGENKASNNGCGISMDFSSNNTLSGNKVSNTNGYFGGNGIHLYNSGNNMLSGNMMTGSQRNFNLDGDTDSDFDNNIDRDNLVDGRPIYYIIKASDTTYDSSRNAGTFYCISCVNVTIKNLNLNKNGKGIFFWNTSQSRIQDVNATNNSIGIYLTNSKNNTLGGNKLSNNQNGIALSSSNNNTLTRNNALNNGYGISLWSSSNNNTIIGNNASSNNDYGINLYYFSNNNTLSDNKVSNNQNGIYLGSSSDNKLLGNKASNNNGSGIYLRSSSNNTLSDNKVSNNQNGISLSSSHKNTMSENKALNNYGGGIYLRSSSNNKLNGNIASNNYYGIYLYGSRNRNNTIYNNIFNNTNNFDFHKKKINTWNTTRQSGTNIIGGSLLGGNFWTNPEGTGFSQNCPDVNGDGICDKSHILDANNIDYLPLAKDKIPPKSVRNLKNITFAQNYINWTWKDPKDIDFKKVMVFIDGQFKKNVSKGKRFYNVTNFNANTKHTISTWTVDINGNINKTWTNRSAWTAK